MTYTRMPAVLAEQLERQLSWCDNDHTRQAIRMVRLLDDEEVLEIARSDESPAFARTIARIGPSTNPSWLTGQAAETAYYRGLIDETELDRLTD